MPERKKEDSLPKRNKQNADPEIRIGIFVLHRRDLDWARVTMKAADLNAKKMTPDYQRH